MVTLRNFGIVFAAGALGLTGCAGSGDAAGPSASESVAGGSGVGALDDRYSMKVFVRAAVSNPPGTISPQGVDLRTPGTNQALVMRVEDQTGAVFDSPNVLTGRWPIDSAESGGTLIEFDNSSVGEPPTFDLWRGYAVYAGGPRPPGAPMGRTRRLVAASGRAVGSAPDAKAGRVESARGSASSQARILFWSDRAREAVISFESNTFHQILVTLDDPTAATGEVELSAGEYTEIEYVATPGGVRASLTSPRRVRDAGTPAEIKALYDHAEARFQASPFRDEDVQP